MVAQNEITGAYVPSDAAVAEQTLRRADEKSKKNSAEDQVSDRRQQPRCRRAGIRLEWCGQVDSVVALNCKPQALKRDCVFNVAAARVNSCPSRFEISVTRELGYLPLFGGASISDRTFHRNSASVPIFEMPPTAKLVRRAPAGVLLRRPTPSPDAGLSYASAMT